VAELSTEENQRIVSRVYEQAMNDSQAGKPIPPNQRVVHDIEHLMQEVNSGASFEQYFRWASLGEIAQIRDHLQTVGLEDVAALVTEAIQIAFPDGLPASEEEKSAATEWTPAQQEGLGALFPRLEDENGRVTNVLGEYARRTGA
jgi:hypothetical protein